MLMPFLKSIQLRSRCDDVTPPLSSVRLEIEFNLFLTFIFLRSDYVFIQSVLSCVYRAVVYGDVLGLNRFLNFHGEDCVRLTYETVHGWKYTPSWLMVALAPLLFLDPMTEVQELHNIFVDMIACKSRWDAFTSKLKGQLQDSNLLVSSPFHRHVPAWD